MVFCHFLNCHPVYLYTLFLSLTAISVRWYILKALGCISQRQLNQFRSLLGATENGEVFPLLNNYRPTQQLNDRYPVYECGDDGMVPSCRSLRGHSDTFNNMEDQAGAQGARPYEGGYDAAESTQRVFTSFNHLIAILAAVVGILCFALTVGSFYFRGVLARYERKLSDHIELELQGVLPAEDSDDADYETVSRVSRREKR